MNEFIESGDRSCGYAHLNQYRMHPRRVSTVEEFKQTMKQTRSAPTTSIKTDESIVLATKDKPYPPVPPQKDGDIYHAMVISKYEVWEDEVGQQSTLIHMNNSWGNLAKDVVVDVDDHPEVIDFALFPRQNIHEIGTRREHTK